LVKNHTWYLLYERLYRQTKKIPTQKPGQKLLWKEIQAWVPWYFYRWSSGPTNPNQASLHGPIKEQTGCFFGSMPHPTPCNCNTPLDIGQLIMTWNGESMNQPEPSTTTTTGILIPAQPKKWPLVPWLPNHQHYPQPNLPSTTPIPPVIKYN